MALCPDMMAQKASHRRNTLRNGHTNLYSRCFYYTRTGFVELQMSQFKEESNARCILAFKRTMSASESSPTHNRLMPALQCIFRFGDPLHAIRIDTNIFTSQTCHIEAACSHLRPSAWAEGPCPPAGPLPCSEPQAASQEEPIWSRAG